MDFGVFSNGFRRHTSAARAYDEDIGEIVLADRLGYTCAYISEHHGEAPYVGTVDTIPAPELMMCKAAALTTRIRMGAAVKLIHLHHPVDVAIGAAVTDHLLGGRFIFGFGSGFATPLFSQERGLRFEDRHARLLEALELIHKCWSSNEPFDWTGVHWKASGVVALPKPYNAPHMPMATATESEDMLRQAGAKGYTLLSAPFEPAHKVRRKGEIYSESALAAGRTFPLSKIACGRFIYLARSRREAIEDLRAAVAYETGIQAQRGFLAMAKRTYGLDIAADEHAIDALVEAGIYNVGEPGEVAGRLMDFFRDSGGFGTLLLMIGKDWADREKRARSMRMFMQQVAPRLRHLEPGAAASVRTARMARPLQN